MTGQLPIDRQGRSPRIWRCRAAAAWRAAALALLATASANAATPVPFATGRGISIAPLVVAGPIAPGAASLRYNVIAERRSPADFKAAAASGLRILRLVTTPLPLMQDDAAARSQAIGQILDVVAQARSSGLSVIVDLHFWSPGDDTAQSVLADPGKLATLGEGTRALAQRLQPLAGVALELLNEPPLCADPSMPNWQSVQRSTVALVRSVAPTLPLVLTGCGGQLDGLIGLDPRPYAGDPNLLYTFHFYEPFIFTHQQTYYGGRLLSIPYPALGRGAAMLLQSQSMMPAAVVATRPKTAVEVTNYLRSTSGDATIAARFNQVAAWRARYHIDPRRIILGEFGTTLKAGPEAAAIRPDQLHWLETVRSDAERIGISWVFWVFPTPGNVDYDSSTGFLRPDTIAALGLVSPTGTTP